MNFFVDSENRKSYLFLRKEIQIGEKFPTTIEIGLHPVAFGWRVRAGVVEEVDSYAKYYFIDLCSGDNPKHISLIYSTAMNTIIHSIPLLKTDRSQKALENIFPRFDIKPIVNDPSFPGFLEANIGGNELQFVDISQEELDEFREILMDKFR